MEGNHHSYGYEMSEDVIEQILLRVKVKSLLRFKCVCKKWYALIQNQTFIRNHFNFQSNHLLSYTYDVDKDKGVVTLFTDSTFLRHEQPHELQLQSFEYGFGQLDGIFCIMNRKQELSLWNPATQEFRQLPISRPDIAPHYYCTRFSIGFGFEPLTSDYKVVWIRNFSHFDIHTRETDFYEPQVISVYTFSCDSWRHFEDEDVLKVGYLNVDPSQNAYLNGFCYFQASWDMTHSALVSFDLCKEVFKEIQIPDDIKSLWNQISVCKNSIALITYDLHVFEGSIDIWLMNESEIWSNHITIGPLLDLKWNSLFLWDYELIRIIPSTDSSQVIIYDLHTQQFIKLEGICQDDNRCFFLDYKESLISLKPKD